MFTSKGGAIQRRVAELSSEQARAGHDVTVLSPAPASRTAQVNGVEVRYVGCRAASPWMHLEFQARSLAIAARLKPDVLHVHNEPEAGLLTRPFPLPTVLSYDNFYFRGGTSSSLSSLYRRSLHSFDLLLPCSRYCREESTRYWGLPQERVHVVPNGVSLSQFAPDPVAAARERADLTGPVVVYLGRICAQKGTDTLLEAKSRLARRGLELDLVLAGPIGQFHSGRPTDTDAWLRSIAEAGARYVGQVDDVRLAGLLSMADVFVMPTAELEMQGMAALEAQACGTPVVASDHGGLPETVPDGCGIRFPPGDADALAAGIADLLEDEPRRRQYGDAALKHARSLAWPRIVEQLTPLYELAVARRRRAPWRLASSER